MRPATSVIRYFYKSVEFQGNLIFDTSIDKSKIKLEQNANKLIRFFHEHHLTVNTSKTEFMIFGKSKRKDFSEQIILDSIPIDERPEVKY